jgi:hypothetical protein
MIWAKPFDRNSLQMKTFYLWTVQDLLFIYFQISMSKFNQSPHRQAQAGYGLIIYVNSVILLAILILAIGGIKHLLLKRLRKHSRLIAIK